MAAAGALTLAACAPVPQQARAGGRPTIVSLNPCSDAILAEVADPAQIRAISAYSRNPASSSMDLALARRLPVTSGSVEELLALRPDVIVSGSFTSPATRQALAGLGLRLEELPIATTLAESEAQVMQLARLAGHPERGAALVARIEAALAVATPPAGQKPVSAVIWESGGIVAGRDTLIADLLRRTGFTDYAAGQGLRQADVLPLEKMIAAPPQVILAAGNLHAQEDRLLAHPALARLTGTRRESLDPSLLWCGGPTIIRAAARLKAVRASTGSARAGSDGIEENRNSTGPRLSGTNRTSTSRIQTRKQTPLSLSLAKVTRNRAARS